MKMCLEILAIGIGANLGLLCAIYACYRLGIY